MAPLYSFVIPVLDEIANLDELATRLADVMTALGGECEVILVDDGSTDGSFEMMQAIHARDPRIKAIRLSRNFGHQLAITAGLEHARGRAVIIMDADLQDPPEIALELAEKWREGFDVVYAVREARDGESRIKRQTAKWFYRLMGRLGEVDIPPDAGDFRLVDRRALDSVLAMPEHHRYLRGLFAWVGYDQTGVHYHRAARHAGSTKFPLRKMLGFAADGIVSFSMAPLRIALSLGFLVSFASIFLGVLAVVLKLTGLYAAPGWASLVVGVSLLGGIQLVVLGVIGEYVARIHEEVKRRPLFLVRDAVGLDQESAAVVADHSYRDGLA
ncbi:MAG: polyisoprenyl-phosphate glycosyltransferase [Actinomycetota bacterium]|jgi:dolichol-phosphate mannosyltransferase|nr:polyisoprenyl-phosphate glycosyltransferase [Actinomycetota bacterium]